MGFLSKLMGRPSDVETAFAESHQHSVAASTKAAQLAAANAGPLSPNAVRKQVVQRILRETLRRNGIPTAWVTADVLVAKSRNREPGLHVRFVIRHWDVRLVQHSLDLQDNFNERLLSVEPAAVDWLMGYSWQYRLQGERQSQGLPRPASWTSPQPARTPAATGAVTLPGAAAVVSGPDIVSGRPAPAQPRLTVEADSEVEEDLAALMMAIRHKDAPQKPSGD